MRFPNFLFVGLELSPAAVATAEAEAEALLVCLTFTFALELERVVRVPPDPAKLKLAFDASRRTVFTDLVVGVSLTVAEDDDDEDEDDGEFESEPESSSPVRSMIFESTMVGVFEVRDLGWFFVCAGEDFMVGFFDGFSVVLVVVLVRGAVLVFAFVVVVGVLFIGVAVSLGVVG